MNSIKKNLYKDKTIDIATFAKAVTLKVLKNINLTKQLLFIVL